MSYYNGSYTGEERGMGSQGQQQSAQNQQQGAQGQQNSQGQQTYGHQQGPQNQGFKQSGQYESWRGGNGYNGYNSGQNRAMFIQKQREQDAKEFKQIGYMSLIYAVIFAFCLYKNLSGITNVVWGVATVVYMNLVAKKFDKEKKAINIFISIAIILFSISNFLTANGNTIFYNYVGIIILIVTNMMYLFYDVSKVNITRHIGLLISLFFGGISKCDVPFRQTSAYFKTRKKGSVKVTANMGSIILGICIAIPIVITISAILASADEIFKDFYGEILGWFNIENLFGNFWGILLTAMLGFIAPYALTKYMISKHIDVKEGKCSEHEPVIAEIVAGAVALCYLLFSFIQIRYLFLGQGSLPSGYSYAEYAREGFFQLLVVSIFNVIMVVVCLEFFKENKILKIILTIVCLCTFIIIASSAFRMGMYIDAYGLTRTRVLVLWMLAVITLIVIGLIINTFNTQMNLFYYCIVIVTFFGLILSFSHMDYYIAKYNIALYSEVQKKHVTNYYDYDEYDEEEYEEEYEYDEYDDYDDYYHQYADYDYILHLSVDAVPAIVGHENEVSGYKSKKEDWLYKYSPWAEDLEDGITMRKFNVSRWIATRILDK